MSEDWRERLILRENGTMEPRLHTNMYLMLKYHPENEGVFWPNRGDAVSILTAKMWLENKGLRPTKGQVIDTVKMLAIETC